MSKPTAREPDQAVISTPTVEILDVDPATAEALLGANPRNRNIRTPIVDSYARDMEAGNWVLNGESLKIDPDGRLIDGQHRLSAIVASGVTVPMVVVRGVASTAMDTVDAGAKRTYADALKIRGETNPATLASIARRAVMWERGSRTNTGAIRPTPREMHAFVEANPRVRTSAELAARLANRERLPASVIGLVHFLCSDIDADEANWFLLRVADGDGLAATHPIAVLRNRITKLRITGGRINETEGLALTIRAWNAYRAGEERSKLQMPRGGLTNENFPEPR